MNIVSELKATILTRKLNGLLDKSQMIVDMIGDYPVMLFPKYQERLIDLAEEEYDLATQLYQLYIENQEFGRARIVLQSEALIERSLFLLKKDNFIIA